ncbi:MAG: hypothetical protein LPJ91_07555 [Pseudazoarcus pumilus]|nr:hypothetical protein [Pseudazoarcus pumilus]
MKKRLTEEQILNFLKQAEKGMQVKLNLPGRVYRPLAERKQEVGSGSKTRRVKTNEGRGLPLTTNFTNGNRTAIGSTLKINSI